MNKWVQREEGEEEEEEYLCFPLDLAQELDCKKERIKISHKATIFGLKKTRRENERMNEMLECQGFKKTCKWAFGPFSEYSPKSTFLISIPYVNIDPSPIKMVPGPNKVIYAKRQNIDF